MNILIVQLPGPGPSEPPGPGPVLSLLYCNQLLIIDLLGLSIKEYSHHPIT